LSAGVAASFEIQHSATGATTASGMGVRSERWCSMVGGVGASSRAEPSGVGGAPVALTEERAFRQRVRGESDCVIARRSSRPEGERPAGLWLAGGGASSARREPS